MGNGALGSGAVVPLTHVTRCYTLSLLACVILTERLPVTVGLANGADSQGSRRLCFLHLVSAWCKTIPAS